MAYRQKTQQLKKAIRKQQLDSFFASKRILLVENLQAQTKEVPLIRGNHEPLITHTVEFAIDDLKRLAKLSQTEPGIQTIAQSGQIESLAKYFSPEYRNSDRQYYATLILCNYYYMEHSQLPNQIFINQILQIIQENDAKIIQNCIILLTNIIYDHPIFRDQLVKQNSFAVRITYLFSVEKVTTNYFISLITLIYRTIYKVTFQASFKSLISPLNQILTSNQVLQLDLIKPALRCFNMLAKMFPQEIRKIIIQGHLLRRLFFIVPIANDVKMINLTLILIGSTLNQSFHVQFKKSMLPFLNKIILSPQQNKSIEQDKQCKLKMFRVIYIAIEEKLMTTAQFMEEPIAQFMLEEFKVSDDSEMLIELVYTFSVVLLNFPRVNHKNQAIQGSIDALIQRAAAIMPDNLQMLGYIKEVDYLREKHKMISVL